MAGSPALPRPAADSQRPRPHPTPPTAEQACSPGLSRARAVHAQAGAAAAIVALSPPLLPQRAPSPARPFAPRPDLSLAPGSARSIPRTLPCMLHTGCAWRPVLLPLQSPGQAPRGRHRLVRSSRRPASVPGSRERLRAPPAQRVPDPTRSRWLRRCRPGPAPSALAWTIRARPDSSSRFHLRSAQFAFRSAAKRAKVQVGPRRFSPSALQWLRMSLRMKSSLARSNTQRPLRFHPPPHSALSPRHRPARWVLEAEAEAEDRDGRRACRGGFAPLLLHARLLPDPVLGLR